MFKHVGLLIGVLVITAMVGGTVYAIGGDPHGDAVISYIPGPGVVAPNDIPAKGLGASDGIFVSLGNGGSIIIGFTDNVVVDGPGADLDVIEVAFGDPENAAVSVSNGGAFVGVGTAVGLGSTTFDISATGLGFVNRVKLVDLPPNTPSSSTAGFDLDAVTALNSVAGVDTSMCNFTGPVNVVVGTAAGEVLHGTKGDDLIIGLGGDDELRGSFGDDCLIGGPGEDTLRGGHGDDVLLGGDNDDLLEGGQGNDHMDGGANDTDPPGDECKGGNGLDTEANCETGSLGRGQP